MPNRIIKETICYSDDIDHLSAFAETVFYRLLVRVDDYGRIDARPSFLKSMLFVTKTGVTEKNVSEAVAQMASLGLVRLYEVDGKPFLCLPKWHLHQRIRDSKAKYPEPPQEANDFEDSRQLAANRGESPPESNPNPNSNNSYRRVRAREGATEEPEPDPPPDPPPDIAAFCQANLPAMNANAYQELADFLSNGITTEMVMYAVNATRDNGSFSWSYARAIMDSWVCKGFTTLDSAKTDIALFKARGQPRSRARDPTGDVPDSVYGGYVDIPVNA